MTFKPRSKFEKTIGKQLIEKNINFKYSTPENRITYITKHTYISDFLLPNGIHIETKGHFSSADRTKHLHIKKQHPDLDIRFVFMFLNTRLRRGSPNTYRSWCEDHGFKCAQMTIPDEWLNE